MLLAQAQAACVCIFARGIVWDRCGLRICRRRRLGVEICGRCERVVWWRCEPHCRSVGKLVMAIRCRRPTLSQSHTPSFVYTSFFNISTTSSLLSPSAIIALPASLGCSPSLGSSERKAPPKGTRPASARGTIFSRCSLCCNQCLDAREQLRKGKIGDTHGLTSILFSSAPSLSGRMTSHSCFLLAPEDAIVLVPGTNRGVDLASWAERRQNRWYIRLAREQGDSRRRRESWRGEGKGEVFVERYFIFCRTSYTPVGFQQ